MATPPSYRHLATHRLGQAAEQLDSLPPGQIAAAVMLAGSAKAQALATIAIAQALLDIADVIRAALDDTTPED